MAKSKIVFALFCFVVSSLAVLNLILVFTPETGFDALWYHLTLPKLWLLKHQWFFPGGLLYYSAMPRLAETIFTPLLAFFGTPGPKFVQFSAGLGTAVLIWQYLKSQKHSQVLRFVGVSLFYATFLVSWQSGSAYIDLIRTLLEFSAFILFSKNRWGWGGVLMGLSIGTKWHALSTLAVYSLFFGPKIIFPALLTASPWFLIAYRFTGNPVYPLFSGINDNSFADLTQIIKTITLFPLHLTRPFDDFLSPVMGIASLVGFFGVFSADKKVHLPSRISLAGIFFALSLNPPSSRYYLSFLPVLAVAVVNLISLIRPIWRNLFILLSLISAFSILGLRLVVMKKYWLFLAGKQSAMEYLIARHPFSPGTFLDTDGYVESLPSGSKILVDRLHNLYYFPRDFDHTSWVKDRSGYDYLVTIGESEENIPGTLMHQNQLGIQIFKIK